MTKNLLRLGVSSLAVLAALPAFAQNFYFGLGYESGERTDVQLGTFTGDMSATSLLAGYRYGFGNGLFAGAEAEIAVGGEYNGLDIDLWRARALFGKDFGQVALFGALGYAESEYSMSGSGKYTGMTYGVGGEYAATDRIGVRLEWLKNDLENENTSGYTWDDSSVRAAAIVKF